LHVASSSVPSPVNPLSSGGPGFDDPDDGGALEGGPALLGGDDPGSETGDELLGDGVLAGDDSGPEDSGLLSPEPDGLLGGDELGAEGGAEELGAWAVLNAYSAARRRARLVGSKAVSISIKPRF
jgi:hypothetical protein